MNRPHGNYSIQLHGSDSQLNQATYASLESNVTNPACHCPVYCTLVGCTFCKFSSMHRSVYRVRLLLSCQKSRRARRSRFSLCFSESILAAAPCMFRSQSHAHGYHVKNKISCRDKLELNTESSVRFLFSLGSFGRRNFV